LGSSLKNYGSISSIQEDLPVLRVSRKDKAMNIFYIIGVVVVVIIVAGFLGVHI